MTDRPAVDIGPISSVAETGSSLETKPSLPPTTPPFIDTVTDYTLDLYRIDKKHKEPFKTLFTQAFTATINHEGQDYHIESPQSMLYQLHVLLETGALKPEQLQKATVLSSDVKSLSLINNKAGREGGDLALLLHYYSHKRTLEKQGYQVILGRPTGDEFLTIIVPPENKSWNSTQEKHEELLQTISQDTQELFEPHMQKDQSLENLTPDLVGKKTHLLELNSLPQIPEEFRRKEDFHEFLLHYVELNGSFEAQPLKDNVIDQLTEMSRYSMDYVAFINDGEDARDRKYQLIPKTLRQFILDLEKQTDSTIEDVRERNRNFPTHSLIQRLASLTLFDHQFGRETILKEWAWKQIIEERRQDGEEMTLMMVSPYFVKQTNKEGGRLEGTMLLRQTANDLEGATYRYSQDQKLAESLAACNTTDAIITKSGASFLIADPSPEDLEVIADRIDRMQNYTQERLPYPVSTATIKLEPGQNLEDAIEVLRTQYYFQETMNALDNFPHESKIKFLIERLDKREQDIMTLFMILNVYGLYDPEWRTNATNENYELPLGNVLIEEYSRLLQQARLEASKPPQPEPQTPPSSN